MLRKFLGRVAWLASVFVFALWQNGPAVAWNVPGANDIQSIPFGTCTLDVSVLTNGTASIVLTNGISNPGWNYTANAEHSARDRTADIPTTEGACGVTDMSWVEGTVEPAAGGTFATATRSFVQFQVTVTATGQTLLISAEISGAAGAVPTIAMLSVSAVSTEEQVSNFSVNRATNLLGNQPQIGAFLNGGAGGGSNPFGALSAYGSTSFDGSDFKMSYANSVSRVARLSQNRVEQAMAAAYKQQPEKTAEPFQHILAYGDEGIADASPVKDRVWDAWVQIYGAHSESGDTSTDFWVGYAGAHYFVTSDVIIGAIAQIDYSSEDNSASGSSAEGLGWMIGPYLAAKLPDHPVYFETRVAWGQSDNTITPTSGAAEDDFDTTRWIASAKLSGSYKLGSVTIAPSVRASYYNERQHSYVDSNAAVVPGQTIEVGELRWGPTFSTSIVTDGDVIITPSLGVNGVWNFAVDEAASTAGTLPGTDDVRSAVNAGLDVSNQYGLSLSLSGYYDGIGLNDYEAYGGTARVSVPFQ